MGVAVHGMRRSPVASGESPATNWKYRATKNAAEVMAAIPRKAVALPALNVGLANSRGGSIGWVARLSQETNPTRSSRPAPRVTRTSVLAQPAEPMLTRPHTRAAGAAVISPRPAKSRLVAEARVSARRSREATMAAAPMGTRRA